MLYHKIFNRVECCIIKQLIIIILLCQILYHNYHVIKKDETVKTIQINKNELSSFNNKHDDNKIINGKANLDIDDKNKSNKQNKQM